MKTCLLRVQLILLPVLLLTTMSFGQLLNNPESVTYDPLRDCHYVSNWGDGLIIKIDNEGTQSVLNAEMTRIAGLLLVNDTLYCAANHGSYIGVTGFNPATGEMIFYAPMEGADLPNDLAMDSQGNLYCTDYWGHQIYKINIPTQTAWVYISYMSGPNGIVYDHINDRMIVTRWLNESSSAARFMAINFADSTVTEVANPLNSGVDGLAMDASGRLYYSSWQTNAIHRYNADLTSTEVFSTGHDAPADISLNADETILHVPNFYWNTVDFIAIPPEGIHEPAAQFDYQVYPCFPNPFNSTTTLKFSLDSRMPVKITAFNIAGREIMTLLNDTMNAGTHQLDVKADHWASGTYFLQFSAGLNQSIEKITLLK